METQEQEYCGTCEMWTSLIKTWYRQRHKASSFFHRSGVYLVPCHVALCAVLFFCFPFIISNPHFQFSIDYVRLISFSGTCSFTTIMTFLPLLFFPLSFFLSSFYSFLMDQVTYLLSKQKYQYQNTTNYSYTTFYIKYIHGSPQCFFKIKNIYINNA